MTILVLGYGNPGRGDDALGPLLAERLERGGVPQQGAEAGRAIAPMTSRLDVAWDYELTSDRAFDLARHDLTLFVDASHRQAQPIRIRRVRPARTIAFSTHAMTPASVVALAVELYAASPVAFLLTIRGYRWGLTEGLSPKAGENLAAGLRMIDSILRDPTRISALALTTGGDLPEAAVTPGALRNHEGTPGR